MKLIDFFRTSICLPLLILIPFFGTSLPSVASSGAASDKQRFDNVAGQLDFGGVLYGYVSVDGDLSGLAKFVPQFQKLSFFQSEVLPHQAEFSQLLFS